MKVETFTDKTAFLEALTGRKTRSARQTPQNGAQQATAALPRERSERTGLSTLLLAGWCNEYDSQMRMRLYRGAQSTAYFDDEKQACDAAKALCFHGLAACEGGDG